MVSQVVQPESNYVFVCYLNHKIKRFFWLTDLRMDSNGAFQCDQVICALNLQPDCTSQRFVCNHCLSGLYHCFSSNFCVIVLTVEQFGQPYRSTCYSVFHLYHQRNVICGQFL